MLSISYPISSSPIGRSKEEVKQPNISKTLLKLASQRKFILYFKDYVGAINRSYIAIFIVSNQAVQRNRKGFLSQNVLAVYNFKGRFTYIYARQEGLAYDIRVLNLAIQKGKIDLPNRKYLLVDVGYLNTAITLMPYRGTRYYLKEQQRASLRLANKEELFNLRYLSYYNAIERAFSILKKRQKIFTSPQEYAISNQIKLVYALTTIYNFIINSAQRDKDLKAQDDNLEEVKGKNDFKDSTRAQSYKLDNKSISLIRERIAKAIQEDYQAYISV